MSITFPDVLNSAKLLANRLKDTQTSGDSLLSQMQSVYNHVEAMKQYHEDISHLNDLASERPRLALVAGIQQENKHIMDLQQENRELRIALEEQQNAIDLIMSKYRQQIARLVDSKYLDQKLLKSIDTNTKVMERNTDEVNDMKYVIRQAIQRDESSILKEEELMSCLWKENRGLRELLQISGTYGSYNTKILGVITEDKGVQTRTEGQSPDKSDVDESEEDELVLTGGSGSEISDRGLQQFCLGMGIKPPTASELVRVDIKINHPMDDILKKK